MCFHPVMSFSIFKCRPRMRSIILSAIIWHNRTFFDWCIFLIRSSVRGYFQINNRINWQSRISLDSSLSLKFFIPLLVFGNTWKKRSVFINIFKFISSYYYFFIFALIISLISRSLLWISGNAKILMIL